MNWETMATILLRNYYGLNQKYLPKAYVWKAWSPLQLYLEVRLLEGNLITSALALPMDW
jgi:hypothetical protein